MIYKDGKKIYKIRNILLLIIVINIALLLGGFNLINKSTTEYIRFKQEYNLLIVSDLISRQIDGDSLNQFIKGNRMDFDFYDEINSLLLKVNEKYPAIVKTYIITKTQEPNMWRTILTTDIENEGKIIVVSHEYEIDLENISKDNRIYERTNNFISIYTPIYDGSGNEVGFLGLDIDRSMVNDWVNSIFYKIKNFLIVAATVSGSIYLWFLNNIYKKINKEDRDRLMSKGSSRFSDNILNRKWDLLGLKLNKTLGKDWHGEVKIDTNINDINENIIENTNIYDVYRDVIGAATQGKILLLYRKEFLEILEQTTPLYTRKLTDIKDISICRREIDQFMKSKGFSWWSGKKRRDILLCLSEATTNAIKHAGSGEVILSVMDNKLIIYVLDNGEGIDLKKLPYSIFVNGFTTEESSLGAGFLLMEKNVDRILLSTTNNGTFLALEKEIC